MNTFRSGQRRRNYLPLLLNLMVLGILLTGSCKKDETSSNGGGIPKSVIVGYESNGSKYVPKLWKNGVDTSLSEGVSNSEALSVSVSGNDIYIAGYENDEPGSLYDDPSKMPKFWKNGVSVALNVFDFGVGVSAGTNGVAMAVAGYNGNAFIVGYMADGGCNESVAVLWENGGTPTLLSNQYDGGSYATTVFVTENGDVYAAGCKAFTGGNGDQAIIWFNGAEDPLTDGSTSSQANSIFVSGSDVYVAGGYFDESTLTWRAVYWKNGEMNYLTDGSEFGMANSIYVSGNDVYVAGEKTTCSSCMAEATYWKNSTATSLTPRGAGAANSIYVSGSDVYVGGTDESGLTYEAVCWKNGKKYSLTDGSYKSFATGIVVP